MIRGLVPYDRAVRMGDWSLESGRPIRRVAGSTLGIIGFGAIGQSLARKAAALEMRVVVHDTHTASACAPPESSSWS